MSRELAIAITLVAYNIALVAIGLWAQRRTADGADFFLGGRKLGPVVAAISASASSSSAWTLLGVSGFAYQFGVSAIWLFPACVGGFVINWFLLARPLREQSHRQGLLTATEVLAGPPDRPLHRAIATLASLVVLVFFTIYVASQFQGAGKTFHEAFGISTEISVLVGAGVVVLYTLLGGFWAVSLSDTVQGFVMALTSLMLPLAALVAVGGPRALVTALSELADPAYLSLTQGFGPWVGAGFVAGLLGIGLGYPGQPHVVNRFMALREGEGELRRARWVAISWAVLVYAGMILLGICGRVLLDGLADNEVVFLAVADRLFSPVVAGIMIAAVLSAIMSTADSQLLVAASSVTHDLGLGGKTTASMLSRSRAVVLLLSVLAVLTALLGPSEIFTPVLVAWSALGAVFGPVLLVTALRGPVSPGRTLTAMTIGLLLAIAGAIFRQKTGLPWAAITERVLPFVVGLLIAASGRPSENREEQR